jgi:hypothetical protein
VSFQIGGGGFSGPTQTPLGGGVSRVLGLQGEEQVGLDAGGVAQPVLVVGDTSDNLSRALITSRFWAANRAAVGAANVFRLRLQATVTTVIEMLRLAPVAPATLTRVGFAISPNLPFTGVAGLVWVPFNGTEIGGLESQGRVEISTNQPPLGFGVDFLGPTMLNPIDWGRKDLLLRPGTGLGVEVVDLGADVDWSIVWREVPD